METVQKIIIDTDIGDDIDDALALALALKSPEVDLTGVTTVFRNTDLRTQLVLKLLETFRRTDVPVARGIAKPLINDYDKSLVPNQCAVLREKIPYNCNLHAVDFIVDKVMSAGDITLVSIGPLTNIASAIVKEPEVAKKTRLVMMGGMVTAPFPEWNIVNDPEAARIVFDSGIPVKMVGLDVTLKCRLSQEHLDRLSQAEANDKRLLFDLIKTWMSGSRILPILHDPLAVASIINPGLLTFRKANIKVETKGEYTRGVTLDHRNVFTGESFKPENPVEVAEDIDVPAFLELFLGRLLDTSYSL